MDHIFLVEMMELFWHNLSSSFFLMCGMHLLVFPSLLTSFVCTSTFKLISNKITTSCLKPNLNPSNPKPILTLSCCDPSWNCIMMELGSGQSWTNTTGSQHKLRNVKVEKKANKLFEISYKRRKDWSIDIKFTFF